MNSWHSMEARRDATWAFCARVRQMSAKDRQRLTQESDFAKKTFADGWFYLEGEEQADLNNPLPVIPKEVEFRVYEFTPLKSRENLVTLLLPPDTEPLPLPPRTTDPVEDVWRCTWSVYVSLENQ